MNEVQFDPSQPLYYLYPMTTTSISDNSKPNDDESSSIYLIAGRMDAQRLMAKRLNELGCIYGLHRTTRDRCLLLGMWNNLLNCLNALYDERLKLKRNPQPHLIPDETGIVPYAFPIANHFLPFKHYEQYYAYLLHQAVSHFRHLLKQFDASFRECYPASSLSQKTASSPKSTEKQLEEIGQFIKIVDDHSRALAKKMHEDGTIYSIYGALDGLNLSYSMIKYSFDIRQTLSASDAMHDWLLTPEGLVIAAVSSTTLIVLGFLGNYYNDSDPNQLKRLIAMAWPYYRDVLRGLRDAYKGIRSVTQVLGILAHLNLAFLTAPLAILLGGFLAASRVWLRYYIEQRKTMMKANAKLLAEIKTSPLMLLDDIQSKYSDIQQQSMRLRSKMLMAAAYGGVIDGVYLYVGVLALSGLSPAALIPMSIFCAVYLLTCISTRVYGEHDYQKRLVIEQTKIELALYGKELEALLAELYKISEDMLILESPEELQQRKETLIKNMDNVYETFEKKREKLKTLSLLSWQAACLVGMKSGLDAYGALATALFGITTVFVFSSGVPPLLLMASVSLGIALLIAFTAHSILYARKEKIKHAHTDKEYHQKIENLPRMLTHVKQDIQSLSPDKMTLAINDSMIIPTTQPFFFQEWFEVLRSFFSGFGKGSKAADFTLNPLQEMGDHGHYYDSGVMFKISVVSAFLHATVLSLRAHARNFGKPPINAVPAAKTKTTPEDFTSCSSGGESDTVKPRSESPKTVKDKPTPLQISPSPTNRSRFFTGIRHSHSAPDLSCHVEEKKQIRTAQTR